MQKHGEKRKFKLACERRRGQRLARAGRSGEEQTAAWPQALGFKPLRHPGFDDDVGQFFLQMTWQDHVAQPRRRIARAEETGEIAARRREWRWYDRANLAARREA
ncbi:MAG: hypothetical protein AB7K04_03585, partial [Pseudorhodoplanes sp.]